MLRQGIKINNQQGRSIALRSGQQYPQFLPATISTVQADSDILDVGFNNYVKYAKRQNTDKDWRYTDHGGYSRPGRVFHIRKMVLELDRLIENGDIQDRKNPIAQPDYWRKRIDALLATSALSESIAARAAALLVQLNRITDTQKKSG